MNKNIILENSNFTKEKANDMFVNNGVNLKEIKGLTHKNGKPFDDVDYCILACEYFDMKDSENSSAFLNANYGVDPNFEKLCREVKSAYDEGIPKKELFLYINRVLTDKF